MSEHARISLLGPSQVLEGSPTLLFAFGSAKDVAKPASPTSRRYQASLPRRRSSSTSAEEGEPAALDRTGFARATAARDESEDKVHLGRNSSDNTSSIAQGQA
jgi:hypothetical protein